MFPLALYVLKMAFFKTPLGKTFPELFYFTIVEAIKSARPGQFLQPRHPAKEQDVTLQIQTVKNTLICCESYF